MIVLRDSEALVAIPKVFGLKEGSMLVDFPKGAWTASYSESGILELSTAANSILYVKIYIKMSRVKS